MSTTPQQRKKAAQDLLIDPEQQQKECLKKAKYKVQAEHYYMVEDLKKDEMEGAIKHATLMLNELRTGLLTPKNYYSLYMLTFDKLRDLLVYFREKAKEGMDMSAVYERVQYTSKIVPRIYLLITAGVAYIEAKQVRAQNILKDMVDMCKGVQHPTRGLFLRHHLSQTTKALIPDIDSDYGGTISESIGYIVTNFRETVNLFSRLKDLKENDPEKEKREKERLSMRTLLGTNLIRMSQLEGCTQQIYKLRVLPALLDIIKKYKDVVAQQFVMECIIQVFPDEFHMGTLEDLLGIIDKLEEGIYLTPIFTSLLDRLANFAQTYPDMVASDNKLIESFQKFVQPATEKMNLEDLMLVKTSMLKLILEVNPKNTEAVSNTLVHLAEQLENAFDHEDEKMTKLVADLIYQPVNRYSDVVTIVNLKGLKEIFQLLKYKERRYISVALCQTAIKANKKITEMKHMLTLMQFIAPLLRDEKDYVPPKKEEIFEAGQNLVARVVHLFGNDNTDDLFKIFSTIRKIFGKGGEKRIEHTLPPLVFEYLKLAERINYNEKNEDYDDNEEEPKDIEFKVPKVLQYVIEILTVLANKYPVKAFHLYLHSAICADKCEKENYVYEYLTQAFLLYEERESKLQTTLLYNILNTLLSLKNIAVENYETLSLKTTHYSNKILMKPQQCLTTLLCSYLFWPCTRNRKVVNTEKALECLQYSFKIVKMCMHKDQMPLFVEILNTYLYHFLNENEKVTPDHITELIEFISKEIDNYEGDDAKKDESSPDLCPLKKYFENIKSYILLKKRKNPSFENLSFQ